MGLTLDLRGLGCSSMLAARLVAMASTRVEIWSLNPQVFGLYPAFSNVWQTTISVGSFVFIALASLTTTVSGKTQCAGVTSVAMPILQVLIVSLTFSIRGFAILRGRDWAALDPPSDISFDSETFPESLDLV